MVRAAIIGGSGYTGGELARILCRHPKMTIVSMTSRQHPGVKVSKIHPFLEGFVDLRFDEKLGNAMDCDLVFVATPYGASMDIIPELIDRGIKVIDLSGDYRLGDANIYRKWYGIEHKDPKNLKSAVYGIPELFRNEIAKAQLVANPGCYPTCAVLALAPLFAEGIVDGKIIVDAKSGTSGAGMEPTKTTHHPNCGANVIPYKVGSHRHTPEIAMALRKIGDAPVEVIFTPHLVPIVRGILCTCYGTLIKPIAHDDLYSIYQKFYKDSRFVRLNNIPSIPSVVGSNFCEVGYEFAGNGNLVVLGALDNLIKGGAGQAIQNANIMFGIEEEAGLDFPGMGV
ncbi:MAG: N-acetyl-gamma-glutamyl-phosphate reductase [Methanomassiliicoccales archaeon]|nr:N-acetyl-gamma-glutamyl-phosphate reductase [Methanomassiliicoccales archaeon]